MRSNRREWSKFLAELYQRLEMEGPTIELELTWLDMRASIEGKAVKERHHAMRSWNHLGYMIMDRKNNFGAALGYLMKSIKEPDSGRSDQVCDWQTVFLYAAFIVDDKGEAISALDRMVAAMPEMSSRDIKRLKMLNVEYLQINGASYISKTMESLMRRLFGKGFYAESPCFLTGEELVSILDPRGQIARHLVNKSALAEASEK